MITSDATSTKKVLLNDVVIHVALILGFLTCKLKEVEDISLMASKCPRPHRHMYFGRSQQLYHFIMVTPLFAC